MIGTRLLPGTLISITEFHSSAEDPATFSLPAISPTKGPRASPECGREMILMNSATSDHHICPRALCSPDCCSRVVRQRFRGAVQGGARTQESTKQPGLGMPFFAWKRTAAYGFKVCTKQSNRLSADPAEATLFAQTTLTHPGSWAFGSRPGPAYQLAERMPCFTHTGTRAGSGKYTRRSHRSNLNGSQWEAFLSSQTTTGRDQTN